MSKNYRWAIWRAVAGAQRAGKRLSPADVERLGLKLLDHPPERRRTLLRNSRHYASLQVASWLVDRSEASRYEDPAAMVRVAKIAVEVAEALSGTPSASLKTDAASIAWAALGNAYRVLGELTQAKEALDRAADLAVAGSGDPLVAARIACLRGAYYADNREVPTALRLYLAGFRTYAKLGEAHRAGRTLISLGRTLVYSSDHEAAVECLKASLSLVDAEKEPGLLISAAHSLAYLMAESGATREAFQVLRSTRPLYLLAPGRLAALRLRWVEGQIWAEAKASTEAEVAFKDVRAGFLQQSMAYDAALVSLDLAAVYLRTRRLAEVVALGQEMHAIFTSQGLADRAAAALLLLVKAAQEQRLTAEILTQVASQIQAARKEQRERS